MQPCGTRNQCHARARAVVAVEPPPIGIEPPRLPPQVLWSVNHSCFFLVTAPMLSLLLAALSETGALAVPLPYVPRAGDVGSDTRRRTLFADSGVQ